ncbi:MAG: two-component system, NarL family, sensor kinase [Pseudonocardiales bacterium]|nr:two-component system, NarL family, sensor kinase [Pseudonocardiales bacterium]
MTGPARTGPPAAPPMRIVATGSHRPPLLGRHGRARPADGTPPDPASPAGRHQVPVEPTRRRAGRLDLDPGSARPGDSDPAPRIALPYLVTALISVLVVALVSVWMSRMIASDDAVDAAVSATESVARSVVTPVLGDAVLIGDPAALARLDTVVRANILDGSMIRVKLWDETGRIVYSDEPRLIGNRFPLGADEQAALRGSDADAGVSDLTSPENRFESPGVQLLEVYLPMRTPSGVPLLFEVYSRYTDIADAAQRIWMRFLPLGIGALVLLELLQVPIAMVLARRLRRTRAQREQALRRSLSVVEDERRRIAGDLHDGVVQDLAGVAFLLGAATRTPAGRPIDPAQIADSAERIRHSVRALRSLLVEIYPPNLYDEGLHAALSDLVARLVPAGVEPALDVDAALPELDHDRVELVYRVAQEGLRNVVQHAGAGAVAVELGVDAGVLVLCITDDGTGCDPDRLTTGPGGLGLRALGAMASQQGAALLLDSGPGQGTTLRLEVPL